MARYKGVEVKESVRPLLPHMPLIDEYREMLQSLQVFWDNLNLLGQMSGTTAEIGQTREAFSKLTSELLNNLAERALAKREQEMRAKSQVVIDILIRNLFERTADIGFLATDATLRDFVSQPDDAYSLQQRFHEYRAKYSVYQDIVLLDRSGQILARLEPDVNVTTIADAWVQEALRTSSPYVEAYGPTALFPGGPAALIYAYRINAGQGLPLGVLALCFRFGDEMSQIFRDLQAPGDAGVMALLDAKGTVIASSDNWQVPVGAPLDVAPGTLHRLRFAGRAYLCFASETQGYQGYTGPGWRGLMMVPLDQAFEGGDDEQPEHLAPSLMASVMAGGVAFPEHLLAIPRQAEAIQRELNRAVWNGMVRQSDAQALGNSGFSKVLLWEISCVGRSMREVFSRAIGNLHATVLSSVLTDSQFFASLAIDIMDRNLYERANDCRWWALDPTLLKLMSNPAGQNREGLEQVLGYINRLYTVYDQLFLFDTQGVIVAVSNPRYADRVGSVLSESWVAECLGLRHSQSYAVSPFAPTPLYEGRPTYTYSAALRAQADGQLLGGIGIVFDSEPQFAAMLQDALPRGANGEPASGSFAMFVDAEARIIASSHSDYRPGTQLAIEPELLKPSSDGCARIVAFAGQVMAIGARASSGYREYKGVHDDYRNAVTAVVFVPLAPHDPTAVLAKPSRDVDRRDAQTGTSGTVSEIATFHVGDHWLGLPLSAAVEAIEMTGEAPLPTAPKQIYGTVMYRGSSLPLYNLHNAMGLPEPAGDPKAQVVVVVRAERGGQFGILVDELSETLEVASADIDQLSTVLPGSVPVLASVVKVTQSDGPMLILLSVETIVELLQR